MTDVALVAMPVASPHHPNLGLSLLKSGLAEKGITAFIRNFYLDYVEFIGVDTFELVSDDSLYKALLGEWVFANCLHERSLDQDLAYWRNVLFSEYPGRFPISRLSKLFDARTKSVDFIDYCVAAEDWGMYKIIGFASSFQQNVASLSLAKRLKELYPDLLIVFGGANCEGDMGAEILRTYGFVDVVFSGEADDTFPKFVDNHLSEFRNSDRYANIKTPTDRRCSNLITAAQQVELDRIPPPDFSEFFEQRNNFPTVSRRFQAVPLFESSRGCWWGAKHHCTFCGLNGSSMTYRSKSQDSAFREIDELADRYSNEILVVDNILDFKYFERFIRLLSGRHPKLLLHYETKVNLSSSRLKSMSKAGIRKIQPGIESLSTPILQLMDKGCTAIQNIHTLKISAESGIYVEWGFLYGFPGENPEHYKDIAEITPKLRHLQPPAGITKVRADRFSPYFNRPEVYGASVRPFPAYSHIYSLSDAQIRRLAYHFDIDADSLSKVDIYVAEAISEMQNWNLNRKSFVLYMKDYDDRIEVFDSRFGQMTRLELRGKEAEIIRLCPEITTVSKLQRVLSTSLFETESVLKHLSSMGLILLEKGKVLALPLRQPGYKRALENHEIRDPLSYTYLYSSEIHDKLDTMEITQ